ASVFFFFSSRRRHTRFSRDWSSDVCSSDLVAELVPRVSRTNDVADSHYSLRLNSDRSGALAGAGAGAGRARTLAQRQLHRANERSEERRVGKERSARGAGGRVPAQVGRASG